MSLSAVAGYVLRVLFGMFPYVVFWGETRLSAEQIFIVFIKVFPPLHYGLDAKRYRRNGKNFSAGRACYFAVAGAFGIRSSVLRRPSLPPAQGGLWRR